MARSYGKAQSAQVSDARSIAELFMHSFNDPFVQSIYSPPDVGTAYMEASWASFITHNNGDQTAVVRVVRDEKGEQAVKSRV